MTFVDLLSGDFEHDESLAAGEGCASSMESVVDAFLQLSRDEQRFAVEILAFLRSGFTGKGLLESAQAANSV